MRVTLAADDGSARARRRRRVHRRTLFIKINPDYEKCCRNVAIDGAHSFPDPHPKKTIFEYELGRYNQHDFC